MLRIHILRCKWLNGKWEGEQIRHCESGRSFAQVKKHTTIPNPMEIGLSEKKKKKSPRSQTSYRQEEEKQASDFSHKRNPPQHHIKALDFRGLSLRQNNIKWSIVRWLQSLLESYKDIKSTVLHQSELLKLKTFQTINGTPTTGTKKDKSVLGDETAEQFKIPYQATLKTDFSSRLEATERMKPLSIHLPPLSWNY